MKRIFLASMAVVTLATAPAGATQADLTRSAIQKALDASAAAWNAGNVNQFMELYKDAPDTVYLSGGKVIRGFKAIHDAYAARFTSGAAAMGELSLDILDFRMVDRGHAFVVGRFHLHRDAASGGDASGLTSLLFEQTSAGWRIVTDHS